MFADEVARVSIASVRSRLKPRVYQALKSVVLRHGEQSVVVEIVTTAEPTCYGGQRRWMRCPRCGRLTTVVGFAYSGAGCKRCWGWKTRSVTAPTAPHVGEIVTDVPKERLPES